MKKILVYVLLAAILANLAACGAEKTQETVDPPDDVTPPVTDLPPVYHATIEYGEPDLITDNSGPLWTYIRFPVAGNATDEVIAKWASGMYQSAQDEIAELGINDPDAEGEINIQFDSYLVDNRYAGVLENGLFMTSHLAHPTGLVRTFNIDIYNETILDNTDILDYSKVESVLALAQAYITDEYPESAGFLEEMDESWLEHIALGHFGIIIMLARGEFLPGYLGTVQVTLPYEDLGDALILWQDSAPEPPEPPEPPVETPAEPSAGPTDTQTEPPAESAKPPMEPPTETPTGPTTEPPTGPTTEPPTEPTTEPSAELPAEPPIEPTAVPPIEPTAVPTEQPIVPVIPPQSGEVDPTKPMIALTFDDGPSKNTARILDTLEKYGGRATFCTVGNLVNARKDTVKRAFDLGCEIIGHSWDHRDLTKLSEAEIKLELNDTSAVIESITGISPKLYRPPYGAVNNKLKEVSAELGYAMINWSVDPEDWKTRNADAVYAAVMSHISDKAIILSHDLYSTTAEAYERIIPELLSKGYQLVTVSELMKYSNKTLIAGNVYHSAK